MPCPDPASCARTGGLGLGEVSPRGAERTGCGLPLSSTTRVRTVSFRKPSSARPKWRDGEFRG